MVKQEKVIKAQISNIFSRKKLVHNVISLSFYEQWDGFVFLRTVVFNSGLLIHLF